MEVVQNKSLNALSQYMYDAQKVMTFIVGNKNSMGRNNAIALLCPIEMVNVNVLEVEW